MLMGWVERCAGWATGLPRATKVAVAVSADALAIPTMLILAITLLIHRDLLGKTITSTLTSCSPHTVATLLMVLLTLTSSPASQLALATEKASTWKFARRVRRRAPAAA